MTSSTRCLPSTPRAEAFAVIIRRPAGDRRPQDVHHRTPSRQRCVLPTKSSYANGGNIRPYGRKHCMLSWKSLYVNGSNIARKSRITDSPMRRVGWRPQSPPHCLVRQPACLDGCGLSWHRHRATFCVTSPTLTTYTPWGRPPMLLFVPRYTHLPPAEYTSTIGAGAVPSQPEMTIVPSTTAIDSP